MPDRDYYAEEAVWRRDVRAFAFGLVKHWLVFLSLTIGSGLCALLVRVCFGSNGVIPAWAIICCPLLGLVVACFLAFRDQRRIAEIGSRKFEVRESELLKEVSGLKSQLDEREKRVALKKKLGDCHTALVNRLREIGSVSHYGYCNQYTESFQKRHMDPDTQSLLTNISNLLELQVGGASVAIFNDESDLLFKAAASTGFFGQEQEVFQERIITIVRNRAERLMGIINSIQVH